MSDTTCNLQFLAKVAVTPCVEPAAVVQAFYGYLQCRAVENCTIVGMRNAYADAIAILNENGLTDLANEIQMALVTAGHVDE